MEVVALHLEVEVLVLVVGHGWLNLVRSPLVEARQQVVENGLSVAAFAGAGLVGRDGLSTDVAAHLRALVIVIRIHLLARLLLATLIAFGNVGLVLVVQAALERKHSSVRRIDILVFGAFLLLLLDLLVSSSEHALQGEIVIDVFRNLVLSEEKVALLPILLLFVLLGPLFLFKMVGELLELRLNLISASMVEAQVARIFGQSSHSGGFDAHRQDLRPQEAQLRRRGVFFFLLLPSLQHDWWLPLGIRLFVRLLLGSALHVPLELQGLAN